MQQIDGVSGSWALQGSTATVGTGMGNCILNMEQTAQGDPIAVCGGVVSVHVGQPQHVVHSSIEERGHCKQQRGPDGRKGASLMSVAEIA